MMSQRQYCFQYLNASYNNMLGKQVFKHLVGQDSTD